MEPETPIPVPQSPINTKIPEKEKSPTTDPHAIRTYASDLAEVMRTKQGSVVKIALAEQARRDIDEANASPTSKKNIFLALGALILIAIGIGIFFLSNNK